MTPGYTFADDARSFSLLPVWPPAPSTQAFRLLTAGLPHRLFRDFWPLPEPSHGGFTWGMFVRAEIQLDVSFEVARARLARLAHGGWLMDASGEAYAEPAASLARVGPLGPVPGMSRLVAVRFYELAGDDDHAVLALRWEAVGAAGGLFPALDADLTLSRVDDQSSACKLSGVYRPPLGALGAGLDRMILNKVAAATIRKLMTSTGDALTAAPETARRAPAGPQPGWSWLAAPELPLAPGGHLQHGKRIRGTRGERHRGHPGSPCSLRPAAHADRVFTFRHT